MSLAAIGKGIGSIFSGAAAWITPITKGLDIIDQMVDDDDATRALKAKIYIEELRCKTIPIVDALHKMGRQLTILGQMAFYFYCVKNNIPIAAEMVAGVSSTAGLYTMMKGAGK